MRKHIILITVFSAALLQSCGEKNELDTLKEERKALVTKLTGIQTKVDALDEQIKVLDTTIVDDAKKVSKHLVKKEIFEHYFEVQGAVEADKNVLVVPEVGGLIKTLKVTEGKTINKGDVIATFDSKVVSDSRDELVEQRDIAKELWEKQERLLSQGVGTDIAVKQAQSQYLSLKQMIENVDNQTGKFKLVAPFTGYVEQVFPVQGQMAGPTTPIIRLISLDKVSVKADISESYLNGINNNSVAQLRFPALDNKLVTGLTLSRVGKFVNPVNRTITVEVELPDTSTSYIPNLMAVLRIRDYVQNDAIVVPTSMIRMDMEVPCVYVVQDSVAVKTEVELGRNSGDFTIIKSGVSAGDELVDRGLRGLKKDIEKIKLNQ